MVKCPHAASGCNYPEAECPGLCTQQPRALWLADNCDPQDAFETACRKELRRLHAANRALLEALKACDEAMTYMSEYDIPLTLPDQVKAAIAKAEGKA